MTIGPEPRTRSFWMSLRRGITSLEGRKQKAEGRGGGPSVAAKAGPLRFPVRPTPPGAAAPLEPAFCLLPSAFSPNQLQIPIEQIDRVMRAGAGFGVVLGRGALDVAQDQALDGAVVEVDVGEL